MEPCALPGDSSVCVIAGCGLSVVATVGLLIAVASLVAEHMLLQSQRQAPEHRHKSRGAWVSCSTACRIFLDPGSNLHKAAMRGVALKTWSDIETAVRRACYS